MLDGVEFAYPEDSERSDISKDSKNSKDSNDSEDLEDSKNSHEIEETEKNGSKDDEHNEGQLETKSEDESLEDASEDDDDEAAEDATDNQTISIDPLQPDYLRAWTSFPAEQATIWYDILTSNFLSEQRFPPVGQLRDHGKEAYSPAGVGGLSFVSNITQRVEHYVQQVIREMFFKDALRDKFKLKGYMELDCSSNVLRPRSTNTGEPTGDTPEVIKLRNCGRPSYTQRCAYNSPGNLSASNAMIPAFIAQYQSPHRLTLEEIRNGLEDMDLESVIPVSENESDKDRCRRKVAGAISCAVSYMVRAGLEFGYISTGEALIFLRVPDDPTTVYYHLSVPMLDVGGSGYVAGPDRSDHRLHLTAAGQLVAFTLQAFQSGPRLYSSREQTVAQMNTWLTDRGDTAQVSPVVGETAPSGPSVRQTYNNLRYCSEACLSSMRRKGNLQDCPNRHLHGNVRHKIDNRKFLQLLQQQLKESYDHDFEPTGLHGSRAALIKVTLRSHGYTVAAKCTPRESVDLLRHERDVYKRLQPIQGRHVPRYLGLIHFSRPYHYAGIADLSSAMILGYAGETFGQQDSTMTPEAVVDCTRDAFDSVHSLGVLQNDPHPFNLRYNTETRTAMIFDFDRAIIDAPKGRKRKRSESTVSGGLSVVRSCDPKHNGFHTMSSEELQREYEGETTIVCDEVEFLVLNEYANKRRRVRARSMGGARVGQRLY